jgi:hypothetical protein
MFKLRYLQLFLAFFMTSHAFAQHQAVVKIDVPPLFYHMPHSLSFEHAVNPKFSVLLTFEGGRYNQFSYHKMKGKGAGLTIEGRYYPLKRLPAPEGLFLSAGLRYVRLKAGYYDRYSFPTMTGGIASAGLATGYKYVYRRFAAELLIGYNWETNWSNYTAVSHSFFRDPYLSNSPTTIRGELSIGYAFSPCGPGK